LIQSNKEPEGRDRSGQQLRRLRKDFPALHAEVIGGGLTVHEASVRAGVFPKRVSVNLSSPASAAKTLSGAAAPEFIGELARLLSEAGR